MKILLVAHGYPPELIGGTELYVQGLAQALVRAGQEVAVVAGSIEPVSQAGVSRHDDSGIRVHRIHRADLYFDHWQKSFSSRATQMFAAILRAERPDLVHVHHWLRLSRDLVHRAALEGIPSIVSLHDHWTSCLISFRVRPDTLSACDAPLGANPCLACAQKVPPRTPWVPREAQHMALSEHKRDILRELALARAVIVPSRAHGASVAAFLGEEGACIAPVVVAPARDPKLRRRAPLADPSTLGRLILGGWGHLSRVKGADLLIEALHHVADPARVELHLAGAEPDPEFARELRALAQGLAVRFHGPYRAEELDRHPVSAVHAMVSATRARESYGFVLDEARALGLPSVLPRAGAFAERANLESGDLLYENGDARDLARALTRLRDERGLWSRLCAAVSRPIAPESAPDLHAERLLEIYERALARGAPVLAQGAPPNGSPGEGDWYTARLREFAEVEWDRSLSAQRREELGLP